MSSLTSLSLFYCHQEVLFPWFNKSDSLSCDITFAADTALNTAVQPFYYCYWLMIMGFVCPHHVVAWTTYSENCRYIALKTMLEILPLLVIASSQVFLFTLYSSQMFPSWFGMICTGFFQCFSLHNRRCLPQYILLTNLIHYYAWQLSVKCQHFFSSLSMVCCH